VVGRVLAKDEVGVRFSIPAQIREACGKGPKNQYVTEMFHVKRCGKQWITLWMLVIKDKKYG
jgi:hypothetical protein